MTDLPRRVALFIDSDVFAGTERHIVELAHALSEQAVHVSIAAPSASPLNRLADEMKLNIIRIEKRGGLLDLAAILKLRKLLVNGRIDLIHAHNGRTALAAAAARWLAGRGTIVATQHFIDPAHISLVGLRAHLFRAAHRWVQRQIHYYIAVSHAARKAMLSRESGLAEKIAVVPNGICAPDVTKLVPARQVREELTLPSDAPLIVCVARLEQEKDVATLVAAMGPVIAQVPDARCVIVGEGSQRRGLEEQISRVPWGRQITLAGFRDDTISVIRAGSLFVLPSLAEPFGLVLLEAMSLGRAVIATAAGGPLEIVKEGETGLLVPPSDAGALAAAIVTLLRDPAKRTTMGAAALSRFRQHFTAEAMGRATKDVYEKAMRHSRNTAPTIAEVKCESC